jgi:ribosomal subunit interface protein
MRIDISGRGIEEVETLRDYVTQRLRFVLSRFGGQITRVGVRLVERETVRGESRLECRLTIRLVSGRKILVDVSDTDGYAAIDRAVERARRFVGLRLDKPRAGVADRMVGASSQVGDATLPESVPDPSGRVKKR